MADNEIMSVVADNRTIEYKENSYLKIKLIDSLEMTKKFLVLYKPMFIRWANFLEDKNNQENFIEEFIEQEDYKLVFFAQKMSFEKGSCEQYIDKIIKVISETLEFVKTEKEFSCYDVSEQLSAMGEELENFEVYQQLVRSYFTSIYETSTLQNAYEYYSIYFWLELGFSVMEELHNL